MKTHTLKLNIEFCDDVMNGIKHLKSEKMIEDFRRVTG